MIRPFGPYFRRSVTEFGPEQDGKEKSFVKESDGLCCNPTSSVYNRNVKV